jgi:hypothetical protein
VAPPLAREDPVAQFATYAQLNHQSNKLLSQLAHHAHAVLLQEREDLDVQYATIALPLNHLYKQLAHHAHVVPLGERDALDAQFARTVQQTLHPQLLHLPQLHLLQPQPLLLQLNHQSNKPQPQLLPLLLKLTHQEKTSVEITMPNKHRPLPRLPLLLVSLLQ